MLKKLQAELNNLAARQSLKECLCASSREDGFIFFKGKKLLDLTNWDFFNLHQNPIIKRAAQFEIESVGIGTGSPRLVTGTYESHMRCEERIAKFVGSDAAVLFSSKNQAVLSLVVSHLDESCLVIIDEELQSPVVDACYLVNAVVKTFSSERPGELEEVLKSTECHGEKLIFVESVSPLSGRKIDLKIVSEIAEKYGAGLVVDESFALGIAGMRGAGAVEETTINDKIYCRYGELGLAIGSFGAFIAGSNIQKDYLINLSKTFRSECSLPTAICEASIAGIDLIELTPLAREKLSFTAEKLREGLATLGIDCGAGCKTPIVVIPFNKIGPARSFQEAIFEKGFLVEALSRTKMLSESGVVRMLINAAHSDDQIESLLNAIYEVYPRI